MLTRESQDKAATLNTSFSYTYFNMYCCCCSDTHPLLGKSTVPVLILADQCFPAAVPTSAGGKCLAIMRIENGNLYKIASYFLEKICTEWLPEGTVILIGSPSQLAKDGLSAYAEEYVKATTMLMDRIPNSVVGHAPPLLPNGSSDRALLRALYELNHWLTLVEGNVKLLLDVASSWMDLLGETSTGMIQEPYHTKIMMPKYKDNPITRRIMCSEPATALPAATNPITEEAEKVYLEKLIRTLNLNSRAGLSRNIRTERENLTKPGTKSQKNRYLLFVGDNTSVSLHNAATKSGHPCSLIATNTLDNAEVAGVAKKIATTRRNLESSGTELVAVYSIFSKYCYQSPDGTHAHIGRDDKLT